MDTRNLVVKIKGDTKDFEKSMDNVKGKSGDAGMSFSKMAGAVAAGQAIFAIAKVGIEKVAGFLGDTVKSANESENAISQLNAVLKSTGSVAGVTNTALIQQANALQKISTFSDEAIMGAQGLLLTFTNVKGAIFNDAIPTILDMSQALGQDLKSSTIQLGKALNDPIKGITALSRVGVSFTEKQKDTIKSLVASGKTMEAQKVILKELKTEFGGSAQAAGSTFAGSMARLKNQIDDVKEGIGGLIVKAVVPLTGKMADFVARVNWDIVMANITKSVERLKSVLVPFIQDVKQVAIQVGDYLAPKFEALWHSLEEKVIPVLTRLWKEVIQPLMPVLGTLLVGAIGLVIDALNLLLTVLTPVINFMLDNKITVLAFAGTFTALAIAMNFNSIVGSFMGLMDLVIGKLVAVQGTAQGLATFLTGSGAAAFGVIAAAAIIAAALIIDAGNRTKAAWDNTKRSIESASKSNDAVILQLRELQKNGTPEQKARAAKTLKGLAEGGAFASGTNFAPGGMSLVGENGPEIVNLPRGSQVIPNDKIGNAGGGNISVTVNMGMYAGMPVEKRQIGLELYKEIVRAARAQGVSLPMIGAVGVQ